LELCRLGFRVGSRRGPFQRSFDGVISFLYV
jgi:hypothetical protein